MSTSQYAEVTADVSPTMSGEYTSEVGLPPFSDGGIIFVHVHFNLPVTFQPHRFGGVAKARCDHLHLSSCLLPVDYW